jgi:tetratricopeptide (TPR) repeat protein
MGIAYAKLDKFKEAIEAFKKVIEIKPDFDNNINGFFISLNCLLKLAFMIILITF